MSYEKGVHLKAHTLFIGRVLYFPISHSNEHRCIDHLLLAPDITRCTTDVTLVRWVNPLSAEIVSYTHGEQSVLFNFISS